MADRVEKAARHETAIAVTTTAATTIAVTTTVATTTAVMTTAATIIVVTTMIVAMTIATTGHDRQRSSRTTTIIANDQPQRPTIVTTGTAISNGNRHDNRGWDRHRNDWANHPNYWDNRRHDRRDYARYRYNYGHYRAPHGYHYRTWHRGDYLPRAYYGSSYVVYDWRPYRLYAPPYGYHWVRVGNDVLLTALATGVVLDVLYNIWY